MKENRLPPHPVLDEVIQKFNLRNDAHLCQVLGFSPPHISKIRSRKIPSSPMLALAIHEKFGMSFASMRELDGGLFVGVAAPVY
jgi:hypothetical protein